MRPSSTMRRSGINVKTVWSVFQNKLLDKMPFSRTTRTLNDNERVHVLVYPAFDLSAQSVEFLGHSFEAVCGSAASLCRPRENTRDSATSAVEELGQLLESLVLLQRVLLSDLFAHKEISDWIKDQNRKCCKQCENQRERNTRVVGDEVSNQGSLDNRRVLDMNHCVANTQTGDAMASRDCCPDGSVDHQSERIFRVCRRRNDVVDHSVTSQQQIQVFLGQWWTFKPKLDSRTRISSQIFDPRSSLNRKATGVDEIVQNTVIVLVADVLHDLFVEFNGVHFRRNGKLDKGSTVSADILETLDFQRQWSIFILSKVQHFLFESFVGVVNKQRSKPLSDVVLSCFERSDAIKIHHRLLVLLEHHPGIGDIVILSRVALMQNCLFRNESELTQRRLPRTIDL
ncbi:hypothetical protein OGAPHI_001819 [Ogataea philodendri]|uniref:Uncharacterized protein n=1 Tax=Ogataea philodendri TaxID=1378263 RepID=A0A9P8PAM3_9ASCO|nr:uncharacterized protein OGAPHI_001819 [Ogataea philodendri]KAH3668065.1 hypothetical protein OGAPHI_001819 [Ogataea philodendri]